MWPFGRTRDKASSGPRPVPALVVRRDWAALPPIQRTVGEHPLTAPSDRFSDDLATHHDPSVTSDEMGHQVSAEGPAGIVLTVARTASTRSDGPAMVPRPRVQRRAEDAVAESGEWDGDEAAPAEARPTPVPAGIQRIAAVERPVVTAPVPELPPLTALPTDAQPVPVISKPHRSMAAPLVATVSRQAESHEAPDVMPAPRLTLGQARRLGLGAPITKVPERNVQRSRVESAPSSEPSPAEPPPTDFENRPAVPNMAHAAASPSASVQRDAATPLADIAAPNEPAEPMVVPRLDLPLVQPARSDEPISEPAASPAEPAATPAPGLVVQASPESMPSRSSEAAASTTLGTQRTTDETVRHLPRSHGEAIDNELATAPVTSAVPAMPSLPLRPAPLARDAGTRNADIGVTAAPSSTAAVAPLVGTRPIATLQRATDHAPARMESPATRAFNGILRDTTTAGASVMEARSDVALLSPPANGDMPAASASVQRSASGAATLALPHRAKETVGSTVASPTPSRQSIFPMLMPPPRRSPWNGGGSNLEPAYAFPPSTSSQGFPLAPSAAAIQRSAETRTEPTEHVSEPPESIASFFVQRASWGVSRESEGAAPATVAAGPPASADRTSERDMDELAARLYDRIRSRLRSELLVDRERAGLLTDWR